MHAPRASPLVLLLCVVLPAFSQFERIAPSAHLTAGFFPIHSASIESTELSPSCAQGVLRKMHRAGSLHP
jgi:hypothetical protein